MKNSIQLRIGQLVIVSALSTFATTGLADQAKENINKLYNPDITQSITSQEAVNKSSSTGSVAMSNLTKVFRPGLKTGQTSSIQTEKTESATSVAKTNIHKLYQPGSQS